MDLISREKALADDGLAEFHRYDDYSKMKEYLKSLPSAFDGMTNGEVIQALFPNMKTEDSSVKSLIGTDLDGGYVIFNRKWWNAPYKSESEGV